MRFRATGGGTPLAATTGAVLTRRAGCGHIVQCVFLWAAGLPLETAALAPVFALKALIAKWVCPSILVISMHAVHPPRTLMLISRPGCNTNTPCCQLCSSQNYLWPAVAHIQSASLFIHHFCCGTFKTHAPQFVFTRMWHKGPLLLLHWRHVC
jgi:hypothetical protein